ncbi:MAG: CHAD domain-containing protein [Campylobacterales bacterium]|nr:CHAD domain-containing protein [Campylobacterales bacterium]
MSKYIKMLRAYSVQSFLQIRFEQLSGNMQTQLHTFMITGDEEALHQYRVAIRSMRSLCQSFEAFIEETHFKALSKALKSLQKESNAMRERDVFLGYLQTLVPLRPEDFQALASLKERLVQEKEEAYTSFCGDDTRRQKNLLSIQHYVKDAAFYKASSTQSLIKPLYTIIKQLLKKIIKNSSSLDVYDKSKKFHALRLDYKTLRYILEFAHVEQSAKICKVMQNRFGLVQDTYNYCMLLQRYVPADDSFFYATLSTLERDLKTHKRLCLHKDNVKTLQKMSQKLQKIFTCKKR